MEPPRPDQPPEPSSIDQRLAELRAKREAPRRFPWGTLPVLLVLVVVIPGVLISTTRDREPTDPPAPVLTPTPPAQVLPELPTQADLNALARDVAKGIDMRADEIDEAIVGAAHSDFSDRFACYWVDGGWVRTREDAQRALAESKAAGSFLGYAPLKGGKWLLTEWRCAT